MKKTVLSLFTVALLVSCGAEKEEGKQDEKNKKEQAEKKSEEKKIETKVNTNEASKEASNDPAKLTSIQFAKTEHDFGAIPKDDKVKTTFEFTNTGDQPYVISSAKGSCGCTVPSYPKTPIAPGETSEIEVVFDSKNKKGEIMKTVTLLGNTDPKVTKLVIKGKIEE